MWTSIHPHLLCPSRRKLAGNGNRVSRVSREVKIVTILAYGRDFPIPELPKDKVIVQDPATRKGGGPVWTPVQYEDAIKLQKIWLENRWCLAKIRNEFVGDKMLSEAGDEAGKVIAFRESVLNAYTNLVEKFLVMQTEHGLNGLEVVGAKFAHSKVAAIIGTEEAKRLKEAQARTVTQVSIRKGTW
jgi:hypothetical protein